MRKAIFIVANTVLGLALAAPAVFADDVHELHKDQAELQKDTNQMHDAYRNGDRKGVENERREIQKDRAEIAQDHNQLSADHARRRHYRHRHHRPYHHDHD
jgi:uncharacterized membrane protein (DUF106 family)